MLLESHWQCPLCHESGTGPDALSMHLLWHKFRRVPEHQDAAVREEYARRIPYDFADRLNEERHALEHGVLYYSRPAFDAYLDYAETTKQREILNAPMPPGLSVEQIEGLRIERDRSIKGILALGEARKLGATADRAIYPFLAHAYAIGAMYRITADFFQLKAIPEHPLEECPEPPK